MGLPFARFRSYPVASLYHAPLPAHPLDTGRQGSPPGPSAPRPEHNKGPGDRIAPEAAGFLAKESSLPGCSGPLIPGPQL